MRTSLWIILWMLFASLCFAGNGPDQGLSSFGNYSNLPQKEVTQIQEVKPADADQASARFASDKLAHDFQVLQENNKVTEVIALCILALVSLVVVLYFLTKNKDGNTGANIVNATGLIFIVVGTIAMVIMARTEQQLTAAVGILGAIAGYLFGSMKRKESNGGEK